MSDALQKNIAQMDPRALHIFRIVPNAGAAQPWEELKMGMIDLAPRSLGETAQLSRNAEGWIVAAETSSILLRFHTARNASLHDNKSAYRVVILHQNGEVNLGLCGNGYDIGTTDNVDIIRVFIVFLSHLVERS